MSKSKGKSNEKKDVKKKGNENRKFTIPKNVEKLSKLTLKKFKKENNYYDSKKELKKGYYDYIIDSLPEAIKFLIKYGHMECNKEVKEAIYEKICDPSFVKHLTKRLKDDRDIIADSLELLPNVIYDIVREASKHVPETKEVKEGTNETKAEEAFDLADLTKVSKLILKKKIKKLTKAGIDESLAFDILSVIPTNKILEKSYYHHIRNFFVVLYQHAKEKEIDIDTIMKKVFSKDDMRLVIAFALLEKKSKLTTLNDKQKAFFNDITKYAFKKLEKYDKDDIMDVLKTYLKNRKNDERLGRDDARRLHLSALPAETYPNINKVINKLAKTNEDFKKYL